MKKTENIPVLEEFVGVEIGQDHVIIDKEFVILPTLHNLYYKQKGPQDEDGIGGACLELGLFGWGINREASSLSLNRLASTYFEDRIKNKKFQEILDDISSDFMDEYWSLYRKLSVLMVFSGNTTDREMMLYELRKEREKNGPLEQQLKESENVIKEQKNYINHLQSQNARLERIIDDANTSYRTLSEMMESEAKIKMPNFQKYDFLKKCS